VGEPGGVTELMQEHHSAIGTGHGPPIKQHGRRPVGAGQARPTPEWHRAGDGPTDDDHGRGRRLARRQQTTPGSCRTRRRGGARRHQLLGQGVAVEHGQVHPAMAHTGLGQATEHLLDDGQVRSEDAVRGTFGDDRHEPDRRPVGWVQGGSGR